MATKKRNSWSMTAAEKKIWAIACRQAKKNFDISDGKRVSYAAGFFSAYFYFKKRGLIRRPKTLKKHKAWTRPRYGFSNPTGEE